MRGAYNNTERIVTYTMIVSKSGQEIHYLLSIRALQVSFRRPAQPAIIQVV